MYCKYCGSELNKDAKFCTNCGASVVSDKSAINNPTPPVNNEAPINNVVNNTPQNNKKNNNVIFIIIIVLLLILIGVVSAKLIIDNFGNKRNSNVPTNIDKNNEPSKDNKDDSLDKIKNENNDKASDYQIYNGYKFKKSSDYKFSVKDNNLLIYSNSTKIVYSTIILNGTTNDVDDNYEELMQNFASQGFTGIEYENSLYKGKEFCLFGTNEAIIIFMPISDNKLMRFALFDSGEATRVEDVLDDTLNIGNLIDLATLSAGTGNTNYGELKIPDGTKSNIKIDTINK